MFKRMALFVFCLTLFLSFVRLSAQDDGLNLPAPLYILLNEGRVERYGIGMAGVSTVTPEEAFVVDFGVAVDGRWIAYRTQEGLFLLDMQDEDSAPVLLDTSANYPPLRQGGQTLAWSSAGDALAYTTEYGARVALNISHDAVRFADILVSPLESLSWSSDGTFLAAEAQGDIWWIYRRNFDSFSLAGALPSSIGVTWLDDARLIFAPIEGGLYLLDLANANAQTELLPPTRLYRHPISRADGSIALFSRGLDEPEIGETGAFFELISLEGDIATSLELSANDVDLTGIQWAPRGELAIAFRAGVLVLIQPGLGEGFTLPIANAVGFGWGSTQIQTVSGFETGRDAYFRAEDTFGVLQVWRLPGDGSPALPITDSEFDVTTYALSPDGETVAYITGDSLYTLDLNAADSAPTEITKVSASATDLTFNVDGSVLIYAVTSQVDGGLWQVDATLSSAANSAEVTAEPGGAQLIVSRQILPNAEGVRTRQPQVAPNINALLIQTDGDRREFAIFDPLSEALLMIGAYDYAHWMRDGRIVAWNNTPTGAQLAILNPAADPVTVIPLIDLPGETLFDVVQVDDSTFRMVTGEINPLGPSNYRVSRLPVAGGAVGLLVEFPALRNPVLSPDGELVLGGVGFNGALGIGGSGQRLNLASEARDIQWR